MLKNRVFALCVMLFLISVSPASAFYRLDPSGDVRINSEGHKVPFPHALRMIRPNSDWKIEKKGHRGMSLTDVSWGDEETWEEAVVKVAKQADSSVEIDYHAKKIIITRNPAPVKKENGPDKGNQKETKKAVDTLAKGLEDTVESREYKDIVPPKHIVNRKDSTKKNLKIEKVSLKKKKTKVVLKKGLLKAQIERICKENKYTVLWEYPANIRLDVGLTLHGSFFDCLKEIVSQLRENGSRIAFSIYKKNKLLVVEEL